MTETASDTDESNGTDADIDADADTETETETGDDPGRFSLSGSGYERMTTTLFWGAFGLLALLAVVATVSLYTSVSTIIDVWVAPDYRPVFRAAFNLAVVLACAIGLSLLVDRLNGTDGV